MEAHRSITKPLESDAFAGLNTGHEPTVDEVKACFAKDGYDAAPSMVPETPYPSR